MGWAFLLLAFERHVHIPSTVDAHSRRLFISVEIVFLKLLAVSDISMQEIHCFIREIEVAVRYERPSDIIAPVTIEVSHHAVSSLIQDLSEHI